MGGSGENKLVNLALFRRPIIKRLNMISGRRDQGGLKADVEGTLRGRSAQRIMKKYVG